MNPKDFAAHKHAGQYRRGGDPYITHPERVAQHVRRVKGDSKHYDELRGAAYLHDTLEDTATSFEEIEQQFGPMVASLVKELTSDKEKIKQIGKTQYLQRKLAHMSSYGLVIKLADRLDNLQDLADADPKWADKYANQTLDIIEYLVDNRDLSATQLRLIEDITDRILAVFPNIR